MRHHWRFCGYGTRRQRIRRGLFIAVLCILGGMAMASSMAVDEISGGNTQPGIMRLFIGAICGAMSIPAVLVVMSFTRILPAAITIWCVPTIVAWMVGGSDSSYFEYALPLSWILTLLAPIIADLRPLPSSSDPSACATCGYDLRAQEGNRCPECGSDQVTDCIEPSVSMLVLFLTWHVVALIVTGTMQMFFVRWLMSLG